MPVVHISMASGRTLEQKRAVVKGITDVLVKELSVNSDIVTIHIHEIGRENIAKSGVLLSDLK